MVKLRNESLNPRKISETTLDRKYQDFFRSLCWEFGILCEICGGKVEVMHHFIPKAQSKNLRYDVENFIPVCGKCHYLFHKRASVPNGIVALKRGVEWLMRIKKKGQIHVVKTIKWLKAQEERLSHLEQAVNNYRNLRHF